MSTGHLGYYQAQTVIKNAKAQSGADVKIEFNRPPLVDVAVPGFGSYQGLAVDLSEEIEKWCAQHDKREVMAPTEFVHIIQRTLLGPVPARRP